MGEYTGKGGGSRHNKVRDRQRKKATGAKVREGLATDDEKPVPSRSSHRHLGEVARRAPWLFFGEGAEGQEGGGGQGNKRKNNNLKTSFKRSSLKMINLKESSPATIRSSQMTRTSSRTSSARTRTTA